MIGTVLLSLDGYYVGLNGELPTRPWFDKQLLLAIVKGNKCVGSSATILDLPNSVTDAAKGVSSNNIDGTATVNLGIATFKSCPPDIMLVTVSSKKLSGGKAFDNNWLHANYDCISTAPYAIDSVSVWLRKDAQQLELPL